MSIVQSPAFGRLTPEAAGLSMTPEEFDAISDYDDNFNFELIHGVLVATPLAGPAERSPNDLLGFWLWDYRRNPSHGSALVETVFEHYVGTGGNRRRADRVIWTVVAGRRSNPQRDLPTIVVEFVSAGKRAWRRDYIEKRDEYLAAGVLEYWVIDRFSRSLTAYGQRAGQKVELVVHEGEVFRPELLPGFELRLSELLIAADRWSDPE
ncbi:MAG: Uma2 family endonuclease [Planctomycetes bacterium]|nr:Uma2 family endonuclease [Planctomycetota bacterium]